MTGGADVHACALDGYEHAACGLLTTDASGAIDCANHTFCGWTGFHHADLIGRRFQDLLSIGSKLFHQTHWMPLLQMQGSVAEVQLEIVHRDGHVIPVLVNAARRDAPPEGRAPVDIAVFVATDRRKYERELLLARRRAEELLASEREALEARARAEEVVRQRELEFRTLAENSPDVILRFDRDLRCVYMSPAGERLAGRSADAFAGTSIRDFRLDPASMAAFIETVEAAFTGHDGTVAYQYVGADGVLRDLQTHVVPERTASGEVKTVLALTRDVTVLRQQERDAQQRALLAEQLVGIVSHDLRNPLNAIKLGAHLLLGVDLGAHARIASRIASAAERANRLTADLLDFTQARLGGGLRVHPAEVDLHQVVADCLDEVRLAWPNRMVEHRRVGGGRSSADPDRIAQVVTNLVNNALTHGAADQPVTVTTVVDDATQEIHVHNTGRPVPAELQPHIFEPMRRGESQVKLGSRSVGLGLYIVREIAVAHGGSVTLRSREVEGTTFLVSLPRTAPPAAGAR